MFLSSIVDDKKKKNPVKLCLFVKNMHSYISFYISECVYVKSAEKKTT